MNRGSFVSTVPGGVKVASSGSGYSVVAVRDIQGFSINKIYGH